MPVVELPDGRIVEIADEDMPAFEQALAAEFAPPTGEERAAKTPGIKENITAIVADAAAGLPSWLRPDDPEALGKAVADNPATGFMLGVGRRADQQVSGLQQLASSPEEAEAIGRAEEYARAKWAEFDEQQLGAEDAGEALFFVGSMLMPGAAPLKGLAAGAKALQAVKNLGGSLGGTALMAGLLEGSKAMVEGESRLAEGGTAAGLTAAGGLVGKGIFRALGAGAGMLGLGAVTGATRSTIRDGLFRSWAKSLFGKAETVVDEGIGAQKAAARTAVSLEGAAARAAAKESQMAAAQAGKVTPSNIAARDWDAWLDVVQGPISPKTGKRMMRGSLRAGGAKAPKQAQDQIEAGQLKLDVLGERNRAVSTLMQAGMRQTDEGIVMFDVPEAFKAWQALRGRKQFQQVYGKYGVKGDWQPGSVAKSIDKFFDDLLTTSRQTQGLPEGYVPASAVLRQGAEDVVQTGKRLGDDLRKGPDIDRTPQTDRLRIGGGIALQQTSDQDLVDELLSQGEQAMVENKWEALYDTWEELRDRYQL